MQHCSSEDKYSPLSTIVKLLRSCPFPALLCDKEGAIVFANDIIINKLGYSSEDLSARKFESIVLQDKQANAKLKTLFIEDLDDETVLISNLICKDNSLCPVSLHIQSHCYDKSSYFVLICDRDASENEMLRMLLERKDLAIRGAGIGIWEHNLITDESYFSEKFKELVGISPNEALTWDELKQLVNKDDTDIFEVFIEEHLESGIPLSFEFRISRDTTDFGTKWFQIKGEAQEVNGTAVKISGSLADVTFEKQMFIAMNKLTQTNDLALEAGNIGIWSGKKDEINGDWLWDWDNRVEEMFGLTYKDRGNFSSWQKKLHPEDKRHVLLQLEKSMLTGKKFCSEYRTVQTDGSTRYIKATARVSVNESGEVNRFDGICYDQSEVKFAQRELKILNESLELRVTERTKDLEKAKLSAETANQAKSDFLAMMSHELRTPMNAVIGSLDLLSTFEQDEESMELIETAKTSASNLVNILNDILDINKIEAGKLELETFPFSISEIIDDIISIFFPVAQKKNMILDVKEDPKTPRLIEGDPLRIKQIIFNLVGNAIKFTNSDENKIGKVVLGTEVVSTNGYVTNIRFYVEDNGIGIDKKLQHKLFTPFSQLEKSTTRKYGGTGLGLTICGKLTDMMGGRLWFDSALGKGSTFHFELPMWLTKQADEDDFSPLFGQQITLISFDSNSSELETQFRRYLEDEGAFVLTLPSVIVNKETCSTELMIILAETLDSIDFDLGQVVVQLPKTTKVCVALERTQLERFRKLYPSIVALPVRPITRIQFSKFVKRILLGEPVLEADISHLHRHEVILNKHTKGDVLVVEDNDFNRKLIKKQLEKLGYQCELAEDGKIGIEKWEKECFKLILTDCHMPEMDGYQMTKMIREKEKLKEMDRIPIIAVTGAAMTGDEELCFSAGMDGFLSKPIQLSDIRKVMDSWYGRH